MLNLAEATGCSDSFCLLNEILFMKRHLFFPLVLLSAFTACGPSSRITSSWKSDQADGSKYKKIIVLGLAKESDRSLREQMEQHIAADLRDLGYDATCACADFGPKAFEYLSEKQALEKLRNADVDAVMTVVLLDKVKERFYVPGQVQYTPYYVYHRRFWGYYSTMYTRVYSEGYYVTDTRYFWETNLFDLKADQLVYSAQSESFDPASVESMAHEYGQLLVKDMLQKSMLRDWKQLKPM